MEIQPNWPHSVWQRPAGVGKGRDVALLVCEGNKLGVEEQEIIAEAATRKIPLIKNF